MEAARSGSNLFSFVFALTGLLVTGACGVPEPALPPPAETPSAAATLTAVDFAELPDWESDTHGEALAAFLASCAKFATLTDDRLVGPDPRSGRIADWRSVCAEAQAVANPKAPIDSAAARHYFESAFTPVRVDAAPRADGKFTGYYEAELNGARKRSARYHVPIYGLPAELKDSATGVPFADRAAIESGYLEGRGLELLWVDDPVDAFILQIQGSGRVALADGTVVRVGYAGNNGHAFVAIGRLMLDRGLIGPEDANMPAIRDWLRANPIEARLLMAENPRFIFFREIEGAGPIGAQGVALTSGRSLAVDPAFVPLGAPLWLDTTWPGDDGRPLRRLVVAQDTGSAITGPVRGDLYWGSGEAAFALAGHMNQSGSYYLLLPTAVTERLEATS